MRNWVTGGRVSLLGSVLLLGVPLASSGALAAKTSGHSNTHASNTIHYSSVSEHHSSASARRGDARGTEVRAIEHGSFRLAGGRASVMLVSAGLRSFRGHGGGGMKQAVLWSRKGHKGSMRYVTSGSSSSGEGGGISCVPFAREVSGIELTGNAATWWDEAAGQYARGSSPETGSVLNFRANSSMHLGHVGGDRSA